MEGSVRMGRNFLGKGEKAENTSFQHFLLFSQFFKSRHSCGHNRIEEYVVRDQINDIDNNYDKM